MVMYKFTLCVCIDDTTEMNIFICRDKGVNKFGLHNGFAIVLDAFCGFIGFIFNDTVC